METKHTLLMETYLVSHYNYACFRVFAEQLEKQYQAMPDCFKNIFTLDAFGNVCEIRDKAEVQKSWDAFWSC